MMQNKILNRWTVIGFTIIVSLIFLTNDIIFYSSSNAKTPEKILFDTNIINLGLDLQGGKEFLLSPKLEEWFLNKINNEDIDLDVRNDFNRALLKFDEKLKKDSSQVLSIDEFETYLEKSTLEDLFEINKENLKSQLQESLSENVSIIYDRIDDKGVTEASIRKIGDKISVEIPGKKNIDKLENLITSSAKLTINEITLGPAVNNFAYWHNTINDIFNNKIDGKKETLDFVNWPEKLRDYLTISEIGPKNEINSFTLVSLKKDSINVFKKEIKKIKRIDPWFESNDLLYLDAEMFINTDSLKAVKGNKIFCLVNSNPIITGDQIKTAWDSYSEEMTGGYKVNVTLNEQGTRKWADFTAKNTFKLAPIIIDNEIVSMPEIQSTIPDGSFFISGFNDIKEAQNLATKLKFGKFNLPLKKVYGKNIDASLGSQMIKLGVFAFVIGISLIIVFMIIYYKISGVIASFGLLLNILFMASILSMLGATLTLPGIAGFILTVGIAIDANVIIFERIKEETRNGLPPLSAIESGYERAFISIVDANITTLLTAIILYFLGSGPIKGFAITLSAGIICSMFTAIYITRTIFNTLYYSKVPKKLSI
tara:strand:- start:3555 stop:5342 length:1788 start_codon:yes stop_codon:yes gene_type:complete